MNEKIKTQRKGTGVEGLRIFDVNLLAIKRILFCQVLSHKTLKLARGINMLVQFLNLFLLMPRKVDRSYRRQV
jgi:predicted nucleic acid-binding protein